MVRVLQARAINREALSNTSLETNCGTTCKGIHGKGLHITFVTENCVLVDNSLF